jgi:hypothetical protein
MRLAVHEATALLTPRPPANGEHGRLVVLYSVHGDGLDVELRKVGGRAGEEIPVSELAALLLDHCVDGWDVVPDEGLVELHKRRTHYEDDDE